MPCYYQKKNPIQRFLMVAALLGMAVMFTWLLAILWYLGERLSILPYFMVGISWFDISWLDLTEGEKWLIFITGMFVIPFIALVILYSGYVYYRKKHCIHVDALPVDLDESINQVY